MNENQEMDADSDQKEVLIKMLLSHHSQKTPLKKSSFFLNKVS